MLVATLGYEEAATRTGIKAGTLRQWAKRFQWHKPMIHAQQKAVTTVTKPADALKEALQDDSKETKLSLSRSIRKGAKALESELPAIAVFTGADKVKSLVNAASMLHNWQEVEKGSGVMPGLQIYSEQTIVSVNTEPHTP